MQRVLSHAGTFLTAAKHTCIDSSARKEQTAEHKDDAPLPRAPEPGSIVHHERLIFTPLGHPLKLLLADCDVESGCIGGMLLHVVLCGYVLVAKLGRCCG